MTTQEAIKQLQTEHDLIANEHDLDGSQFAPALLEALAMAIEALNHSEIPNSSEPKCANGCIYGWGSSECGHCDYRSEDVLKSLLSAQPSLVKESRNLVKDLVKDTIGRQNAIDAVKKHYRAHDNDLLELIAFDIERLPSAQPEIIWCKDCKHYYYADNRIPQEQRYSCDLDGERWKPDDFCSYAERRTDADMRGKQDEINRC